VLNKIKNFQSESSLSSCYQDLIHLFISVSHKSSVAYISCIIIFTWFLYDFIPHSILFPWIAVHISYQAFRFYFAAQYKDREFTKADKVRFQYIHIILASIGGLTWGIGSVLCIVYAPTPYEYMVLILIVGMASGAISTLSPLYGVYLAYNIPMLVLVTLAFFYQGDDLHLAIAYILIVFIVVVLSASWDVHQNLRRSVELKELYAQSQEELKEVNNSLEERVKEEVEYNRQKDQQMLEQSRLAQMGEMLSMIAHQWRQPLSAITATTGSVSLHLQLDECDEAYIEERLQKINTFTQYLSTTISDFRNFFKPDKEKMPTSLNEVVSGSLKIIGSSLEAQGVAIETFLESKDEFLSFPNELKQVVLNILKNAQDVFYDKEIKNPRLILKTVSTEDNFELNISDNAGGISEEILLNIFDPYFTTKHQSDGTGLGLYMSKMIVEDHCSGHLKVENTSEGACFYLIIPRV